MKIFKNAATVLYTFKFNFTMTYIIHKMSISLKIMQITLGIIFVNDLLKSIIDFYFLKKLIFLQHYS